MNNFIRINRFVSSGLMIGLFCIVVLSPTWASSYREGVTLAEKKGVASLKSGNLKDARNAYESALGVLDIYSYVDDSDFYPSARDRVNKNLIEIYFELGEMDRAAERLENYLLGCNSRERAEKLAGLSENVRSKIDESGKIIEEAEAAQDKADADAAAAKAAQDKAKNAEQEKFSNYLDAINSATTLSKLETILGEVDKESFDDEKLLKALRSKIYEREGDMLKTEGDYSKAKAKYEKAKGEGKDAIADLSELDRLIGECNDKLDDSAKSPDDLTDIPASNGDLSNTADTGDEDLSSVDGISTIDNTDDTDNSDADSATTGVSSSGDSNISISIPGMGVININGTGNVSINISVGGGSIKINIANGNDDSTETSVSQSPSTENTNPYNDDPPIPETPPDPPTTIPEPIVIDANGANGGNSNTQIISNTIMNKFNSGGSIKGVTVCPNSDGLNDETPTDAWNMLGGD